MTSVRVPIMFCGEWIEQNGHYRFNGTEARGIMVPRSTTPDSCPEEPVEPYVEGECLSPNNFVAEDQSIFEFVPKTQPNDRRSNEENVNVIVHDDVDGITVSDPTLGNVAHSNNRYMPRVNLFACSSSFDTDNSHSNTINLPSTEVVGDSDWLMGKKLFSSKEELQQVLFMEALRKNFEFKTFKSGKNILVVKCVDNTCKWRLRAMKFGSLNMFKITKYYSVHSCALDVRKRDHRHASFKLIGHKICHKFDGASSSYRPGDIREDFQKQFGFEISYHKAWKAREYAMEKVRGTPEDSFKLLPLYMEMLKKKNSGTCTFLEVDNANNFKYFFMAIGGCIHGFISSIRPVIAIDGTFLKGKFKGTLFIATALDGNNQLYHVAFGVGDSENDASWGWFLMKLKVAIGEVPNLVFISDKHPSIQKNVNIAFPNAAYGICTHHLKQNLRAKFKEIEVGAIVELAAKAYRPQHFNYFMNEIQKVDERVVKYLQDAGYEKWAHSHFDGLRYSIMTTNIAESMNYVLKNPRQLPIHKLLASIIDKLREWFCDRREEAVNCHTRLTKWAEKELLTKSENSRTYKVVPLNMNEFIVKDGDLNGHVNILDKTCNCREFQLDQLPCEHALAVCRYRETLSVYDMCSRYYSSEAWVTAYAETIYHVGTEEEWEVSEEVQSNEVLHPVEKRKKGRPQQIRIPSQGEEKLRRKCGRCGSRGHNRLTCSLPMPLSSNEPVVRPNET
ncbi:SWIM-type domain-containing protein [Citrus sinensis]|uniref:SWIM-type domain-containing protein n=1 Tax=Citrus sinensis TaxID=2711 RepID=A0ACB8LB51_CITSI|nr:SWIM-type domain-containing protein [Citrus sinensis]